MRCLIADLINMAKVNFLVALQNILNLLQTNQNLEIRSIKSIKRQGFTLVNIVDFSHFAFF